MAIIFFASFLLANHLLHEKCDSKSLYFLNDFIVLAACESVLKITSFFYDEESAGSSYSFSHYLIMLIVIGCICFCLLGVENGDTNEECGKLFFCIVAAGIPLTIAFNHGWAEGRALLYTIVILIIFTFTAFKFCDRQLIKKINSTCLEPAAILFSLFPLMTSFYVELVNVLNQHEVFVAHPLKYYRIAVVLMVAALVILIIIYRKNKWKLLWKKIAFPCFVFGIACMAVQLPLVSEYDPDLFETANASILISDFLYHGNIPIVEHYGGHMMTGVWEGILYGLINSDYAGAIMSPYSVLLTPLLILLFYFLIANIWNREMALCISLLFPFNNYWSYYGLGMLVCFAVIGFIKKNSYGRALLIWLAFAWCALYRLDLGYSFGLAAIISLIVYAIIYNNRNAIKEILVTLSGTGIFFGGLWTILCISKDLDPITRLKEFLVINLSNQNWAYTGIGNTDNVLFAWAYIFLPAIIAVCLVVTILTGIKKKQLDQSKYIAVLMLGFAYIFNFSRGLVRHSMAESATIIAFWSAYIFISLFVSIYKSNNRVILPTFILLILLNTLFIQDTYFSDPSIADSVASKNEPILSSWVVRDQEEGRTFWEQIKKEHRVAQRVVLTEEKEAHIKKYELMMNCLLDSDETYVDFINQTFVFSAIGKKDPAYVSQSPLQLSGEFSQEQFINEIKGTPLIVMPVVGANSLDGITNAYRYYKVYEYICQNYVPLCKYGNDFAVWCLQERKDELSKRVNALIEKDELDISMLTKDAVEKTDLTVTERKKGTVILQATGIDPMIINMQDIIEVEKYAGNNMVMQIKYETTDAGVMNLYYTNMVDEPYTEEKRLDAELNEDGLAEFIVPVTEDSKIRLDIPPGCSISVKRIITTRLGVELIDYGYDGPVKGIDALGNEYYNYDSLQHIHNLNQLPRIWAEMDKEKAIGNPVVSKLKKRGELYIADENNRYVNNEGNYLWIEAIGPDWDGAPDNGNLTEGTVVMGNYNNGVFSERCRYTMTFTEGKHDYLVRCSTDYYWYLGETNAVRIDSIPLNIEKMSVLKGD